MGRDPNEGHDSYIQKAAYRLLKSMGFLERLFEEGDATSVSLMQVSIQGPRKTGGDYRAILKGVDEAGKGWVSFVNGNTLEELHNNITHKGEIEGFKWREDKPFPAAK